MGRIGKRILEIPTGVTAKVYDGKIEIKGPKGVLVQEHQLSIVVEIKENKISTICNTRDPKQLALQGLYNSLIKGMIEGVVSGFEKKLEMVGVGYRAAKQGKSLQIQIGYSHPVMVDPPEGIELLLEGTNKITVKGANKQLVGEVAAKIKKIRSVEPYKGKGIRYVGQVVRKKAGKAAKVAGAAAA